MKTVLRGGKLYKDGALTDNGSFEISDVTNMNDCDEKRVIELDNSFILPSFCDVHVHFREPGFGYKETIRQGSLAGARGGYTVVGTMPNLKPAPCDMDSLRVQQEIIDRDAVIQVIPYGTITKDQSGTGTLSDMEGMANHVLAFSDDGKGVQDDGLMREAMNVAKSLNKLIVAHCEDESLLREGKVRESEWRQIERDLKLADETGCGYHVCHISCKESVEVIRDAKKSGVNVTCETAPHYLVLDTEDVRKGIAENSEAGGRFKMNPPIKDPEDRKAMIEGALDGTVDMIATDHAPHSAEEKTKGFEKSLNGITGLECAFPVLYTGLVRPGVMTLERLVEMMAIVPRKRFGLPMGDDYVVMDLENPYVLDSSRFLSMGKCTPFDGWTVYGKTQMTFWNGKIVYEV
ncbi:dihydroorotase [Mogibacterium kristiansenii]|uniref:Dihydroorotase n=1 Tax=Mogibacterium kristiansenii TaxID=2606708 RepID=A0A6N7XKU5_9FIRM|nr:dihydroorotase [Mogibacterium kristiansenii]MDD6700452.1 dihydroorotase [Mogibacterium kristiansenii]MST70685.1 dihydroorotase [Mogibacterium kristiansenii]